MNNKLIKCVSMVYIFCLCSCNKNYSYDFINEAENNILNKNYLSALKKYNLAEKNNQSLLAVDINNALVSAVLVKDWKESVSFAKKLVMKGANLSFFDRAVFEEFKTTNYWKQFKNDLPSFELLFKQSINKDYLDSLNILKLADQEDYCQIPTGGLELTDAFFKTRFLDSILNRLIVNNGYPSEELIGANIINDTILSPLPQFYGLLRHSYQANSNIIVPHLNKAVESFKLKPDIVKNISDMDNAEFVQLNCKIYQFQVEDINRDKKASEFMRKKILFNLEHPSYGYVLFAPYSIFHGQKIEDLPENYANRLNFIANSNDCLLY